MNEKYAVVTHVRMAKHAFCGDKGPLENAESADEEIESLRINSLVYGEFGDTESTVSTGQAIGSRSVYPEIVEETREKWWPE